MNSQQWLLWCDNKLQNLEVNQNELLNILQINEQFKIIIVIKEKQSSVFLNKYGLCLEEESNDENFFVITYYIPNQDKQQQFNNFENIKILNLVCLLLSTFIVYEKQVPDFFDQHIPIDCQQINKDFLPTAYQITSLSQQQLKTNDYKQKTQIKSYFNGFHEIYLNTSDYISYIIKEFLQNSYQFKKLKFFSLDNFNTFKQFLQYVFNNIVKITLNYDQRDKYLQKLKDFDLINRYLIIEDQVQQYENNIQVYKNGFDNQDISEIEELNTNLVNKCIQNLKIQLQNLEDQQVAIKKLEKKLEIIFNKQLKLDGNLQDQQQQREQMMSTEQQINNQQMDDQQLEQLREYNEFDELLEKEFMILKEKLEMNQYNSYENYEQDLQIFINFCFDNLLDRSPEEYNQYIEYKEFIKIKLIYQFVYCQNTNGALFFMNKQQKQEEEKEQMNEQEECVQIGKMTSMDSVSIVGRQQQQMDEQEVALELEGKVEELGEKVGGLQGLQGIHLEQHIHLLQLHTHTLVMLARQLTTTHAHLHAQLHHTRQQLHHHKLHSTQHQQPSDQYFYEKVVELEAQLQHHHHLRQQEASVALQREQGWKQQVEALKHKLDNLYTKNITESREITRAEGLHQKEYQQLQAKLAQVEEENQNKFNQIRQLQIEKEKERVGWQERVDGLEMEVEEGQCKQEQLAREVAQLVRQQAEDKEHQVDQSQCTGDIYKQLNHKLEEENEQLHQQLSDLNQRHQAQGEHLQQQSIQLQQYIQQVEDLKGQVEQLGQQCTEAYQQRDQAEAQQKHNQLHHQQAMAQQLQEAQQAHQQLIHSYDNRITRIKAQIKHNNPFLILDDNHQICQDNSQCEPNGLNNSLFNLLSPNHQQQQSQSQLMQPYRQQNQYELKILEYQKKVQVMQEEKGELINRIDDIYNKYLQQNIGQTNNNYNHQELQTHIYNLKNKIHQEINSNGNHQSFSHQTSRLYDNENNNYKNININNSQLSTSQSKPPRAMGGNKRQEVSSCHNIKPKDSLFNKIKRNSLVNLQVDFNSSANKNNRNSQSNINNYVNNNKNSEYLKQNQIVTQNRINELEMSGHKGKIISTKQSQLIQSKQSELVSIKEPEVVQRTYSNMNENNSTIHTKYSLYDPPQKSKEGLYSNKEGLYSNKEGLYSNKGGLYSKLSKGLSRGIYHQHSQQQSNIYHQHSQQYTTSASRDKSINFNNRDQYTNSIRDQWNNSIRQNNSNTNTFICNQDNSREIINSNSKSFLQNSRSKSKKQQNQRPTLKLGQFFYNI